MTAGRRALPPRARRQSAPRDRARSALRLPRRTRHAGQTRRRIYGANEKGSPRTAIAWMIVGLLESQRGRDAAAVAAFRQAEPNSGRQRDAVLLSRPIAHSGRSTGRRRRGVRTGHYAKANPQRSARYLPGPGPGLSALAAERKSARLSGTGWKSSIPTTRAFRNRSPRTLVEEGQFDSGPAAAAKAGRPVGRQVSANVAAHGRGRPEGETEESTGGVWPISKNCSAS